MRSVEAVQMFALGTQEEVVGVKQAAVRQVTTANCIAPLPPFAVGTLSPPGEAYSHIT
jgi:hypothetical protein